MPRIRTIKPEFWADEKLSPLPPVDRLVFLGLISMADDAGRVLDSVKAVDGFLFPESEDTCRDSLGRLSELGRIERGLTSSGQRVIQIANWSKHQRIDKPNMASALPAIVVDDSPKPRRKLGDTVADLIWERDAAVCQSCGRAVRRNKVDRYDSGDDLGEIDHVVAVADGGTNAPENLRLLCLPCNRRKAGDAVRRRGQEDSETNRGNVAEASAPRSTTNEQRSVPRSTSSERATPPVPTDAAAAAIVLASAANRAITERWGEQPSPIRHDAGSSHDLARTLIAAAVPIDFARDAIYTCAKESPSLDRPPRTLKYFHGYVVDRWQANGEHAAAASSGAKVLAPPSNGSGRGRYDGASFLDYRPKATDG